MKKIITSNISSSVGLPLLGRSIDFMQENVQEQAVSLAYSNLNTSDDSIPIALYGCVGTFSTVVFTNDTYTITKGAILYNGEIYQVPAMSATRASISETIVFRVDTNTYQSGEPTLYTDGTSINTNQNRTIKIYNGMTGTGIVDAINLKYLNSVNYTDGITGVSEIFQSITPTVNAGTTWGNITAKIQKKNSLILLNANFSISQTSGSLANGTSIDLKLNDKYKFVVDDDFGLSFPVSCRIINNSTLAYIRSENLNGLTHIGSLSSVIRCYSPTLSSNERAVITFNFIGQQA